MDKEHISSDWIECFFQKQEVDHLYEYEEHTLVPPFFHVGVFFRIKKVTTLSLVKQ